MSLGQIALWKRAIPATLIVACLCVPLSSLAQNAAGLENDRSPTLQVELNAIREVEGACRLIFMATNTLGRDLTSLSFETVLIDAEGIVDRLTIFDFQDLPNDRTRVRQFDIGGTECASLGTILINGIATCVGEGLQDDACIKALTVTSRVRFEVLG